LPDGTGREVGCYDDGQCLNDGSWAPGAACQGVTSAPVIDQPASDNTNSDTTATQGICPLQNGSYAPPGCYSAGLLCLSDGSWGYGACECSDEDTVDQGACDWYS
jgi:hypothetical protein